MRAPVLGAIASTAYPLVPSLSMSSSSRPAKNLPWLIAISAVLMLVLLPSSSFSAAQPIIVGEWGISSTQAGVVFSAHQCGYVLATIFLVSLTDRLDSRVVVAASALAAGLANLLFPILSHDIPSAAVLRALAGVGLAGVYMPGLRLVAEQFSGRRGAAVGMYVAAFYLGSSLSLVVTGVLLGATAWREAMLAVAGAACLAPVIALCLFTRPRTISASRRSGLPDFSVLKAPAILLVTLAYSAHTWELYVTRAWISPYLTWTLVQQGVESVEATARAASTSGLVSLPTALGVLAGGALSDRLGRARGAGVFLLTSGLTSLCIGWLSGAPWPVLVAIVLIYGLLVASDSAVYSTAITELAEPNRLGATQAAQTSISFSASVVAPVVAGIVLDSFSADLGWPLAFGQAGLVALLGVVCLSRLNDGRDGYAGKSRLDAGNAAS
jgi:MFS family permease